MTGTARTNAVSLPSLFTRYQPLISAALRAELASQTLPLYDTLRYHMGWVDEHGLPSDLAGGKAFRPTLCLLSCEAAGGAPERVLPAAAALEFVHNFSLIHDDIEDNDRVRHHRLTVWAIWGIPTAIISGTCMLKVADMAATGLLGRGVAGPVAMEASEALTRGYLRMMEGQYLDMAFESRRSITVPEYLDMIERKTGALIEAAVHLGSLVAGGGRPDRSVVDGLRTVGWELGRVFQIRDDILGVWGGPRTGKPVGADIQRRKKALPAVHALEHARGASRAEIEAIYARESPSVADVERVLEIMDGLRTQAWCQTMAEQHWAHGLSVIKSLRLAGETARDFEELGEFLLIRDS